MKTHLKKVSVKFIDNKSKMNHFALGYLVEQTKDKVVVSLDEDIKKGKVVEIPMVNVKKIKILTEQESDGTRDSNQDQ